MSPWYPHDHLVISAAVPRAARMPWNESRWKIVGQPRGMLWYLLDLNTGIFHGLNGIYNQQSDIIWYLGLPENTVTHSIHWSIVILFFDDHLGGIHYTPFLLGNMGNKSKREIQPKSPQLETENPIYIYIHIAWRVIAPVPFVTKVAWFVASNPSALWLMCVKQSYTTQFGNGNHTTYLWWIGEWFAIVLTTLKPFGGFNAYCCG